MWSPELGVEVILQLSGCRGRVIAISNYLYSSPLYYVEYLDNTGNPGVAWFSREQLGPVI
jgi:hypothetical protein